MKLSMRIPRHFVQAPGDGAATDDSHIETGQPLVKPPINPSNIESDDKKATEPVTCLSFINPWRAGHRVHSFCRFTALVHLAAAILFLTVTLTQDFGEISIPRLKTPITRNIAIWINASEQVVMNDTAISNRLDLKQCPLATSPPAKDSAYVIQQLVLDSNQYELDTRALIIAFHMLSFIFQGMLGYSASYSFQLDRGFANYNHFIEYSISASVLLIAMAAQATITDIFLIVSIVANCTGCMILGLVAEILYEYGARFSISPEYNSKSILPDNKSEKGVSFSAHWVAHITGWFLISVALIAANSNLISMTICAGKDGMKPPAFVPYLVGGEIFCFVCFGFVQMYSFTARESADQIATPDESMDLKTTIAERKKTIAYTAEFLYILLSATAKLYLGFIVFIGNYTNT
jgi:hypothetical protein